MIFLRFLQKRSFIKFGQEYKEILYYTKLSKESLIVQLKAYRTLSNNTGMQDFFQKKEDSLTQLHNFCAKMPMAVFYRLLRTKITSFVSEKPRKIYKALLILFLVKIVSMIAKILLIFLLKGISFFQIFKLSKRHKTLGKT